MAGAFARIRLWLLMVRRPTYRTRTLIVIRPQSSLIKMEINQFVEEPNHRNAGADTKYKECASQIHKFYRFLAS